MLLILMHADTLGYVSQLYLYIDYLMKALYKTVLSQSFQVCLVYCVCSFLELYIWHEYAQNSLSMVQDIK